MIDEPEDLIASGGKMPDLKSFLLKLDDDQKAFVGRFDRDTPQGPWLLKGGPGSGKSVVALYCIRELIEREQRKLPGQRKRLRILLTTYTNSLIKASRHLLEAMGVANGEYEIRVDTLDEVVKDFLPDEMRGLSLVNPGQIDSQGHGHDAIRACGGNDKSFSFSVEDTRYLVEEVDWVIVRGEHNAGKLPRSRPVRSQARAYH